MSPFQRMLLQLDWIQGQRQVAALKSLRSAALHCGTHGRAANFGFVVVSQQFHVKLVIQLLNEASVGLGEICTPHTVSFTDH